MTLTSHAVIGALVAKIAPDPFSAFLIGAASHYLADVVPHGDEFLYWRHVHNSKDRLPFLVALSDCTLLTIFLIVMLIGNRLGNPAYFIAGVIGGILPDILVTVYTQIRRPLLHRGDVLSTPHSFIVKILHAHYRIHSTFHTAMRTPIRFRTGLLYQAIGLLVFLKLYLLH